MKIYDNVYDYLENHNVGDRVVFEGHGISDGLKNIRKNGTYKITKGTTDKEISLKAYRGRKSLTMGEYYYNQKVAVLSDSDWNQLPTY